MDLDEKLRSIRNEHGVTLYDHLLNVLGKILLDKQTDPYNNFEKLSYNLKSEDVFLGYSDQIKNLILENGVDLQAKIKEIRNFLKLDKPIAETDQEEEVQVKEEEPPTNITSNLLAQQQISKKCGVSLGEEDSYIILKSLKHFSGQRNALKCTFWGKIMAQNADYFVVECPQSENKDREENGKETVAVDEPLGTGVNSKTYFVTTDILSNNWTELPLVSAKQIRQARKIRHLFTGDLSRRIFTSPEFEGEERHFVS